MSPERSLSFSLELLLTHHTGRSPVRARGLFVCSLHALCVSVGFLHNPNTHTSYAKIYNMQLQN